nr:MAG TPA: hypothetical protein [Caudoviricetes sp.]
MVVEGVQLLDSKKNNTTTEQEEIYSGEDLPF